MPSENQLIQIRRIFKMPDTVVIRVAPAIHAFPAHIGKQPGSQKYNIPAGQTEDEPIGYSELNTPVFSNIHLIVPTYTDNLGRTINSFQVTYDSVLITVGQTKKIVTTSIQGRDGTVKEYIGKDDYTVTVNGIITGPNGVRPVDDIARLYKMLDAPVEMEVACAYLQNIGIHSLVVFDYSVPQDAGGYSYQAFSITFKSDVPQQLRLTGI